MPRPAGLQTLRFDPLKLCIQREEQGGRRRVGSLKLRDRALESLEVEIEPTTRSLPRPIERAL